MFSHQASTPAAMTRSVASFLHIPPSSKSLPESYFLFLTIPILLPSFLELFAHILALSLSVTD